MKSMPTLHSGTKRFFLLVITLYIIFGYINLVCHAKGHVGIIKLQHAYADLIASSKKNLDKGISEEHIELFKAHDRARHGRVLTNAVQFSLGGNYNPYLAGIYYTRISMGTPPKEYHVQVDTGSDLLWLNCNPCTACAISNNLGMIIVSYDPHSQTSSPISCDDPICDSGSKIVNTRCYENYCGYSFQYGDKSSTTGYLIEDTFMYRALQSNKSQVNTDAKIVFGCGFNQSGNLLTGQSVVDGIMGFGQSKLSIISQLYMQGLTPGIFAHCLQGSEKGGGVLVLGNVMDPQLVFTPIVSSQTHYNVNLKGISVNGVEFMLKSSAYATTNVHGTIFDSGTSLAYLMEPVYTSVVTAIIKGAPSEAYQVSQPGETCFIYSGSVDDDFPIITLHFEGADMKLKGSHYLIRKAERVNAHTWCIGWHSTAENSNSVLTILGDIVLKDKIVVYDLENQRIGWVDYDCSNQIAVSGNSPFVHSDKHKSFTSSSTRISLSFSLLFLLTSVSSLFRKHIL